MLRQAQLALAWIVGVVGVAITAISLAPAVITIAAVGRDAGGPAVLLMLQAVACLAVPVLVALAIADVTRRWWLWLISAAVLVLLLLTARPITGSLDVFWLAG